MRLPRWLAPAVLGAAGLGCAGAAWVQEGSVPAEADEVGGPTLGTPVLSVRRIPEVVAAPIADRRLRQDLAAWAESAPGESCAVVRVEGEELLSHRDGEPVVPASTLKLLTAAAALARLGPDHRFRTVVAGPAPTEGVVRGNLALVGGGDPVLATPDYAARYRRQPQIFTDLSALADAVVDAGIRRVEGSVVGDEGRFDRQRYVAGWPERYIIQNQTGPLSALSVNDGFVEFPTPAQYRDLEPAGDPAVHAAAVFTGLLAERGVIVTGPPVSGTVDEGASELAVIESPPLDAIVDQLLLESDNATAELLVKELGQAAGEPTTRAGVAQVAEAIRSLGLDAEKMALADGSGLSLDNRITCDLIVDVLEHPEVGDTLRDSIPVAGETGTLSESFLDTGLEGHLAGKTGRLNSVAALAGFVADDGEPDITYAYVVNVPVGQMVPLDQVFEAQTRLGRILLDHPRVPSPEALGPRPVTPG